MNNIQAQQKKASYFIIAMIMWEFFSYYGMQALLILYLTQALHFAESDAFNIYGAFTSLIYVTPIVGGWLADRYCGYRYATLCGCLMIILGHLTLGLMTTHGLYWGLSFLILGIGLFKSNAICLIGDCYPNDPAGRSAAFAWYYVSGNLGSIGSQLLCPYLAERFGWHAGFIAAAFGMVLGVVILMASRRYFSWYRRLPPSDKWINLSHSMRLGITLGLLALFALLVNTILRQLWVGYVLMIISVVGVGLFTQIYLKSDPKKRRALLMIVGLTLFAMGFWIFDQQGSSSISLFIQHFVDRTVGNYTIPAGMFQSINPTIILIFGTAMAWVWRYLSRRQLNPLPISKLNVAMIFLMIGFYLIAQGAKVAEVGSLASMMYPIAGLVIVGAAEIFVDPVLLSTITEAAPKNSEGQLVALYYLATGAIANYLAGKVANWTIDPTQNSATATTYYHAYMQILWIAVAMFAGLLVWRLLLKWKARV